MVVVAFSPPVLEFVAFCAFVRCRFLWSLFIFFLSFSFLFSWDEGGEEGPKSLSAVMNYLDDDDNNNLYSIFQSRQS